MKYGQPLVSTELSGKLGGVVGATARGGVGYFRRRVTGSNPMTPAQTLVRSIMTSLSSAWQNTLTEGQRAGWAAKADAKESGIDVYVKGNFQQLITGVAAATATAPATVALGDTPITTIGTWSNDDGVLSVTLPAGTQTGYAVYVSKVQKASRLSRQFAYTYVTTGVAGDTEVTIPVGTGPTAGAVAGDIIYVRFVAFGSASPKLGRVGQPQEFRVTVVT